MKSVTDTTFESALSESGKPVVLVDFWAPWCSPCVQLGSVLRQVEMERSWVLDVLKINIDENPKAAEGRTAIPYLEFYKDGQLVDTSVGALSKRQLLSMVDKYWEAK